MRAITIRQPWAWAIIHGGKDIENRTRNIAGNYRGTIAIHAGKTPDWEAQYDPMVATAFHRIKGAERVQPPWLPGCVIGVADLVGVHGSADCYSAYTDRYCSPWAMPDSVHLILANQVALPEPIPCRGHLGLWTLPDDIADLIGHQLRSAR